MPTILADTSIQQFQLFIKEVYALQNDRYFDIAEMLNNIQRFAMRGLKGIRKGDAGKTKKNLMISFSWFIATLNRLHINLENEVWRRFPNLCSYCGSRPCSCKAQRLDQRQDVPIDNTQQPRTLIEYQKMFHDIYPPSTRTLEHAGVHLAEETGEFTEALLAYRGERTDADFQEVMLEAADYFSCLMGVFNSLGINFSEELARFYNNNCHVCYQSPCLCSYTTIKRYK